MGRMGSRVGLTVLLLIRFQAAEVGRATENIWQLYIMVHYYSLSEADLRKCIRSAKKRNPGMSAEDIKKVCSMYLPGNEGRNATLQHEYADALVVGRHYTVNLGNQTRRAARRCKNRKARGRSRKRRASKSRRRRRCR